LANIVVRVVERWSLGWRYIGQDKEALVETGPVSANKRELKAPITTLERAQFASSTDLEKN